MANTVSVLNILVNAQTGAAVGQLTALDGKLKQTAATANKTSTSIGAKLGSAAKLGGAALAVGVVAGLVKSVKAASEFETSFAEVRKTVDASEKGFGRLEKGLRGLAKQIPINVNDLNDLAGQAGALGIASKDIVRFTRTAAELGIATDMSAEEASNALARLSNIMGTSSKDFRRLGSSFVALGNDGASTEREIAAMALRLAATGKQVGLNESQVLSFSSALASVGIEAEAGGSAFSRAFSLMSESVATGNDTLAKFAEVAGMGPRGFAALFERNAARGMVAFIEGLGKIKREGGNALAVLSDMGINEVRLRNALLSAAGAGNLFNKQLRVGSDAWRENNALTKEAQERYGTSASKVKLLGNRANDLAITIGQKLDPAVRGLLDGLLALTSGDVGKWLDRMKRKSQGASDAVDVLRNAWKVLGPVFDAVIQFVLARLKALWDGLRNVVRIVKGMVVAVAGLLSGDWRKAWNGAKAIVTGSVGVVKSVVRGLIAPLKGSFVAISKIMASIFGGAWEKVRDTFRDGANAAIRVVNNVIDVLNRIPGVPDIGRVGLIVNPDNTSRSGRNARRVARQRGGTILGGRPSGDSVPAMLERGEYVLNRNAVQRVGVKRLNELNFKQASRFQDGGPVGMIGGGLLDAAGRGITNLVPGAGLAGKALGKGAGFFIKQLPKPDIPEPFAGVGPWLIEHVTKWIKGKVPGLGGKLGNVSGSLGAAMRMAQQMGLTITSTTGGTHAPNSWHYAGRAFDASNGVNTPEMRNYFLAAAGRWGSSMLELFYDPIGWYIKNGAKIPGAIGGHSDHVHTAMQNGGLVGSILRMVTGGAVVKQGAPVLARKGFDHKASAGIFGNAWQESTWNPLDRWRIPGFKRGRDAARTTLSRLRGERTTLVGLTGDGGELGDTMFRLRELGAIVSGGSEPFSIQDILRIVESARLGVYEGLPRFHSGGVVPGVPGSEVPIMAQAGETVVRGGVGDVTVNVDFADGMGWLREFMDVRIEKHDRVGGQRARVGVR